MTANNILVAVTELAIITLTMIRKIQQCMFLEMISLCNNMFTILPNILKSLSSAKSFKAKRKFKIVKEIYLGYLSFL